MNILKSSATLQTELIRKLWDSRCDFDEALSIITDRASEKLQADACAIYLLEEDQKTAVQRSGSGYQKDFVHRARCQIEGANQVMAAPKENEKIGLTAWILSKGKSFQARTAEELKNHPHHTGRFDNAMLAKGMHIQTFLGVPIYDLCGKVVGVIKAERCGRQPGDTQHFEMDDEILLETFAHVATISMAYFDMAQKGDKNEAINAWTRSVIAETAATEGELDGFLDIVVEVIAAAMNADSSAVYLIDDSKKTLTQRAGCGVLAPRHIIRSYELPTIEQAKAAPIYILNDKTFNSIKKQKLLSEEIIHKLHALENIEFADADRFVRALKKILTQEELKSHKPNLLKAAGTQVGLTAWIAATGESVYAPNFAEMQKHPHHRGAYDPVNFQEGTECGAFLGIPLQTGGTTIGVVKVENTSPQGKTDPRQFDESARYRFELLAQNIALSVAYLQKQSSTRYQVISAAMPKIFEILRGDLDVPHLVKKAVEETANLFNARACALFLKEGNRLVQRAATGWATFKVGAKNREYLLVDPESIKDNPSESEKVALTVWIACKREKFVARSNLELIKHPHHKGTFDDVNFQPDEQCESLMGVPLEVEGGVIGVLKVETKMRKIDPGGDEEFTYFSDQDELVFDLIARCVAIAIENSRLLESKRLSEQINKNPNNLLVELHAFVKNHWQAENTLKQVADLLRGKRDNTATIIENYARLLGADFSIDSLRAILNNIGPMKELIAGGEKFCTLYNTFVNAMTVQTPADISSCCSASNILKLDDIMRGGDEYLYKASTCLKNIYDRIAAIFRNEPYHLDETTPYAEAITALKASLDVDLEAVPQPERLIIKLILTHWLKVIQKSHQAFRRVQNPYIAGPAIKPIKGGPFFGRRDIFQWVAETIISGDQKNILLLHGQRRMGKTSILLQLNDGEMGAQLRNRNDNPLLPVFIDLQGCGDNTATFITFIISRTHQKLRDMKSVSYNLDPPTTEKIAASPFQTFNDYMERVNAIVSPNLLVLMLDEFEQIDILVKKKKVDAGIYSTLRFQTHLSNITYILAGSHSLEELSGEYIENFNIAYHKEVGFMNHLDAGDLIKQPVHGQAVYEETAVKHIVRITNGHPFLIQQLCHGIIDEMNRRGESNYITDGNVDLAVNRTIEDSTHIHFYDNWRQSTENELKVIRYIASNVNNHSKGMACTTIAEKLSLPSDDVDSALKKLNERRLISHLAPDTVNPEQPMKYQPTILLFYHWVNRHFPNTR